MKIVSFNQVIEVNKLLDKKELPFKLHIRDACGGQSFYIEQLPMDEKEGVYTPIPEELYERMNDTITQYFKAANMQVVYENDKLNFTIQG